MTDKDKEDYLNFLSLRGDIIPLGYKNELKDEQTIEVIFIEVKYSKSFIIDYHTMQNHIDIYRLKNETKDSHNGI